MKLPNILLLSFLFLGFANFITCSSKYSQQDMQDEFGNPILNRVVHDSQSTNEYHDILIRYCTSWGMKKNFLAVRSLIERDFPNMIGKVHGENYPPAPYTVILAQIASSIWLLGIILAFFGTSIFGYLKIPIPALLASAIENKFGLLMFLFLLNNVATNLTATGAFEVSLDGESVFSKLSSGRLPSGPELIDRLRSMGL